jgi:flavin reductase (DIM6/NTAB) family NADH-FMN oxidoreductase RutF
MRNPFATPPEKRTPARRLRGRLAAPVTIWTSGTAENRAGLTVSSVMVAEGDPSFLLGLINDTTDLWEAIQDTRRFVVHLLPATERVLAERFAGLRPSPGGLFAGLEVIGSDHGPVVTELPNRAQCLFMGADLIGYQQLIRGQIEGFEPTELDDPLLHFRGAYHRLAPPR